jgi:hypothetical protein
MNDSSAGRSARAGWHGVPPLVLLGAGCLMLLFGGLAIAMVLGGVMPLPYGPAGPVLDYARAQPVAVQAGAVGAFGTASAATITLTTGTLAAAALGLTGLLAWTLSRPDVSADPALVRALYFLVFLVGGPGHLVALGLLVAGMAAPALVLSLLPKPLAWAGLAIAVVAETTTLVLVWPRLGVILPIARISALLWLLVAGAMLPPQRAPVSVDHRTSRVTGG